MFEEELIKRDWKEYKQLEPVLEEINRLKCMIDKYENSTHSSNDSEVVLDLKAKLQALMEERAILYKGQSATASKLLGLNEKLEAVSKERDECKLKVGELEKQIKELQGIILRGEFESIPTSTTLKEIPIMQVLVLGTLDDGSWFGWTGKEFLLDGNPLPKISEAKARKLFLNDSLAIAALEDGSITIWGCMTGRIKHTLQAGQPALALDVSEETLVSVQSENVKVWDLRHGYCVRTISARMDERAWVFLDGDHIIVVLGRGKVKVFGLDGAMLKNSPLCKSIVYASFCKHWMVIGTGEALQVYNKLKLVKGETLRDLKMLDVSGDTSASVSTLSEVDGKWYLKKACSHPVLIGEGIVLDMKKDQVLFSNRLVQITF